MHKQNRQELGFCNIKREKRNSITNRNGMCPAVRQRAHGLLKAESDGSPGDPYFIPQFQNDGDH